MVDYNDIMVVNFISTDQKINNFGLTCLKSEIFSHVEEKIYLQYPEFRETNNTFLVSGKIILRFKTMAENNIKTGDKIQLISYEN